MDNVEAFLLDFDGVLVDSVKIKSAAFQSLYADQPAEIQERVMDYHRGNDGISRLVKIRHCHETILGVALSEAELTRLAKRYTAMVEDAVVTAPWVPGARALLEGHVDGVPRFVVSGTPEEEVKRIAERRGMTSWLVEIRGSPPGKADIVRDLIARYRLAPDRCLFVGDAMADWRAAHETGVPFVGRVAPGREHPCPEGTRTVPDLRAL